MNSVKLDSTLKGSASSITPVFGARGKAAQRHGVLYRVAVPLAESH
jgi:hypothetical protein